MKPANSVFICAVFLSLAVGCGGGGGEELSFIERSDGQNTTDTQETGAEPATLKSRLEIYANRNEIMTLLVLPLKNNVRDERLNWLAEDVPETLLVKLETMEPAFKAYNLKKLDYLKILANLPRGQRSVEKIASAVFSEYKVDYLLFGDINMDNRKYIIEPLLVSFDRGAPLIEKLSRLEVRNIMSLVNPLAIELCDRIKARGR